MAKLPAPVHPDVAAELANSAIEDGESSVFEKYLTLCAECELIAIQIQSVEQRTIRERICYDEHATRHC